MPPPDPSCFQILETSLYTAAKGLVLLDSHLERMHSSASQLSHYYSAPCFPCDHISPQLVESRLSDALRKIAAASPSGAPVESARVRILLSSDGSLSVQAVAIPLTSGQQYQEQAPPLLVLDCQPTLDLQSPFVFCKTTHRLIYDAAVERTLVPADYPHGSLVLLYNTDGHITEANIANVAVSLPSSADGGQMRLVTPPISAGLLPGTMRNYLLRTGKLIEGVVTVDQFKLAVRNGWPVMCMNSVRGLFPVTPVVI
ncbi:hypothetical protein GGI25_003977 [Coemansia spiralis]|uniref:Uncharacterized protein n=2 Tax=Coemansia TaxID=4863 RepID=A0A9W8KXJ6_9FUNG|nr:aminotransferase [Coemansia spiralis]KAJ1990761.1 hypothetical protein EDC05_003855 [Coemansia umbellata]KAJ2620895.1 hypothetical protein GGI26_004594 [Coemansia sp. RSA 1358]KAJ2675469.1 hypothetical protein GGI25_003977 [Coemansia spiralis]